MSSKILSRIVKPQIFNCVRHKSLIRGTSIPLQAETCKKVDRSYWEEIRIPVPWGHIAGKAWGNKNGLPVLGIHGWLDNAGTFDTLAPLLLDSLYFVAVDLPGHGLSSPLPSGISYNSLGYLLTFRRIVKHFKWDSFSVIGHSLGAGLGANYAGVYPQEVDRLILLDLVKIVSNAQDPSYPQNFAKGFDLFLDLEDKAEREETPLYTFEQAMSRLIKGTKNHLNEESAKILMIRGASQVGNDNSWKYNRDVTLNAFRICRFTHESLLEIHRQIRCPVLLLKAKDGFMVEPKPVVDKFIAMYQETSSNFQMVETGQGHFFHLNEPTQPAELINNFFKETCQR